MKRYGIYVAYPPTVDLAKEGLGRYLAAFVKAGVERESTQFVIACPSWTRDTLDDLFKSEGVPRDRFEILSPPNKPYVLRLYDFYLSIKKSRHSKHIISNANDGSYNRLRFLDKIKSKLQCFFSSIIYKIVRVNSIAGLVVAVFSVFVSAIIVFLCSPIAIFFGFLYFGCKRGGGGSKKNNIPVKKNKALIQ